MNRALLTLAWCALLFAGCRTTRGVLDDYARDYASGAYEVASKEVSELAEKRDGTELMYRLLSASALRNAGATQAVLEQRDKSEDVMGAYDRKSVFASAGSGTLAMLTNDRSFPYDGGGQDRVFTCLYKGVEYAVAGDVNAARTEFNRAGAHQENWLWERRKDISAAKERMDKESAEYAKEKGSEKEASSAGKVSEAALADADFAGQLKENLGYDTATSGNLDTLKPVDWMNPYASHVTGVFRWLNGDEARSFLKDAAECRKDNAVAAADYKACDSGERPADTVWVWVEDGLCPTRKEWRIDLPLLLVPYANKYILYAGMAFPKLEYRGVGGNGWALRTSDGGCTMDEIADVDRLVRLEYDVYLRGALTREITRTVVKIGAQVALGVAADNTGDWRHQLALRAAQVGVAAWAAGTTAADERSWTALPKRVLAGRVKRPADGKVSIIADGGVVAELTLPPGNSMVFVVKPSPDAKASVKSATYPASR